MKRISQYLYLFTVYAFLYIPLLILMIFSVLDQQHHFTWQWYQQLANDPNIINVAVNSLLLAISSATIATILGTVAAICLNRYRFLGRKVLTTALFSYIILPDIVIAVSLLIFIHIIKLSPGFLTLLIGHTVLCLPFVCIMLNSRLFELDASLFEAVKDLGASEFTLYRKIFIPLLLPAIISAALLCFTLSIDDVIISFFLSGPGFQVLPLYIYSLVRLGFTPEINAICSIIFVSTLLLIVLARLGMRKK